MPSSCLGVNRMGMNWLHPIWSPKRQTEPVSSTASSLLFLAGLYLSNYLSMDSMYLVSLCSISVYFCLCLCLYPRLSRSVQLSFPSESADDFDYQLELTHVLWISTRWSHVWRVEPASTAHASTCCFTWVLPEDGQLHQNPISLWVRNQPGFPAFQTGTFPTNPLSFITLRESHWKWPIFIHFPSPSPQSKVLVCHFQQSAIRRASGAGGFGGPQNSVFF